MPLRISSVARVNHREFEDRKRLAWNNIKYTSVNDRDTQAYGEMMVHRRQTIELIKRSHCDSSRKACPRLAAS